MGAAATTADLSGRINRGGARKGLREHPHPSLVQTILAAAEKHRLGAAAANETTRETTADKNASRSIPPR